MVRYPKNNIGNYLGPYIIYLLTRKPKPLRLNLIISMGIWGVVYGLQDKIQKEALITRIGS